MPRLLGIDIPKEKRIEIALTYVYGIGRVSSNKILKSANISPDVRARDLTEEEISRLTAVIQKDYKTEGDLRRDVQGNIRRMIDNGSYVGYRHRRGLPVRGRRTKTNSRTRKGKKKTVGVIRDKTQRAAIKTGSK
jgi:small subunit ribosomal protein S13